MGFFGKIILTGIVITIVYFVYRNRTTPPPSEAAKAVKQHEESNTPTISTQTLAYIFIGLIVCISTLIFALNFSEQHTIVNIRVLNGSDEMNYQAYKKSIKGRSFQTLDGKLVTVGESERIEMTEAD
ncbi:MAG: hypothetical protein ACNYPI_10445 [Arenicellales bacterium WSBS_2016_MAG_OTU3]